MSYDGKYFSPRGKVVLALEHLDAERATYLNLDGTGTTLKHYSKALANALSVLYSATGAVWQFWNLWKIYKLLPTFCNIVAEYGYVRTLLEKHDQTDESVYGACLARKAFLVIWFPHLSPQGEDESAFLYEDAELVCENVIANSSTTFAIRLITMAQLLRNPAVNEKRKNMLRNELWSSLRRLIRSKAPPKEMNEKIGQGYKTICRVARSIGYWEACRVSIGMDGSIDLRFKTWLYPRYLLHVLFYYMTLSPLWERLRFSKIG